MECIDMRRVTTVIPIEYKARLLKISGMEERTLSSLLKGLIEEYLKMKPRYQISKSGKKEFFINTDEPENKNIRRPCLRITAIIPWETKQNLEKLCFKEGRTISNMMKKIIKGMIMNNGIDYKSSFKVDYEKIEKDRKINKDIDNFSTKVKNRQ